MTDQTPKPEAVPSATAAPDHTPSSDPALDMGIDNRLALLQDTGLHDVLEVLCDARTRGRTLYNRACSWNNLDPDECHPMTAFSENNPYKYDLRNNTAILIAAIRRVKELDV